MKIENKNFTEEELLNLAELQFVKYNFLMLVTILIMIKS